MLNQSLKEPQGEKKNGIETVFEDTTTGNCSELIKTIHGFKKSKKQQQRREDKEIHTKHNTVKRQSLKYKKKLLKQHEIRYRLLQMRDSQAELTAQQQKWKPDARKQVFSKF